MTQFHPPLQPLASGQLPDPFWPAAAVIREVQAETPGVATLRLEFQDADQQAAYRCEPGQFNMLYVPGIGEVAISISSAPGEGIGIGHTIRFVGMVTRVIEQLRADEMIGLRGPYGMGWPLGQARGQDVVIVGGGLGLAPLRPAITMLLANRAQYGRLILLYGARHPSDLLYSREYDQWRAQGLEVLVTVDHADSDWTGRVGVVPQLLKGLKFDFGRTLVFTCGPGVMMHFTIIELLAQGLSSERIFLSIERNMQCGVGLCGRCQLGPFFVCKDGPVFAYNKIGHYFKQERF